MKLQGINVQSPWASSIIDGLKTIETRTYDICKRYLNVPIALVETPGTKGDFKARIIGMVWFSSSFQYKTKDDFNFDYAKHLVTPTSNYCWNERKPKYGWIISKTYRFQRPFLAPSPRGIVWTGFLEIPLVPFDQFGSQESMLQFDPTLKDSPEFS